MGTPHKHAELIKAWADGAEIEFRYNVNIPWSDVKGVCGWDEDCEFRIKPEPKPDDVKYACFYTYEGNGYLSLRLYEVQQRVHGCTEQLKLTFDGETGKLKSAEVL